MERKNKSLTEKYQPNMGSLIGKIKEKKTIKSQQLYELIREEVLASLDPDKLKKAGEELDDIDKKIDKIKSKKKR